MKLQDFEKVFEARREENKYEHKWNIEITFHDNSKKKMRVFRSQYGSICQFNKRSRRYGHPLWNSLDFDKVVSVRIIDRKDCDRAALMRKRAKKALEYVTASGLWPDLKAELEYFLKNVDIADFCNDVMTDTYERIYNQRNAGQKYDWLSYYEIFISLCLHGFKSIHHYTWNRESKVKEIEAAISNKQDYSYRWENGYDNSLEITFDKQPRGWYSEEYRGCGNGHYYFLLDATHAVFGEDD